MSNNIIKDPFNYSGNKSKLIPLIKDNLPRDCTILIDLFGGGGCVALSLADNFKQVVYNEINKYIYGIIKTFSIHSKDFCLDRINHNISYYQLNKNNKKGFLKFREDFNRLGSQILLSDTFNGFTEQTYLDLYTLIVHSFNYFCTIDKSGKFINTSGAGRCWFNPSLYKKFIEYKNKLDEIYGKKLFIYNEDFRDLYKTILNENNNKLNGILFFVDPVYKISDDIYRRSANILWTEQDENDLYNMLEDINELGGKFILTNQLQKGNVINNDLLEFSKRFNTIDTKNSFKNCSYQHKRQNDEEILVKNYYLKGK